MIDKLKLAYIDHADRIRDKDKMHREQREFEIAHDKTSLIKVNSIY